MYGMVSLAIILFGIVFMYQISGENQRAPMKGYHFSFSGPYGCAGIPVPQIYSPYYFTADTVHNDSTLQTLQKRLRTIGQSYDSLHAADIIFADNTPYEFYLKAIAICHEFPPKQIVPYENHMYVHGRSKYQLREDSAIIAANNSLGILEME